MYLKLPKEKLEKALNYLKDKPWIEVAIIMEELTHLEIINEENNTNPDNGNVSPQCDGGNETVCQDNFPEERTTNVPEEK